jgi:hypothetical protein
MFLRIDGGYGKSNIPNQSFCAAARLFVQTAVVVQSQVLRSAASMMRLVRNADDQAA